MDVRGGHIIMLGWGGGHMLYVRGSYNVCHGVLLSMLGGYMHIRWSYHVC